MQMSSLADLPSVERILQTDEAAAFSGTYGRPLTLRAVREALEDLRGGLRKGDANGPIPVSMILESAQVLLAQWTQVDMRPVINATGVILHTNLGRAPLSRSAIAAIAEVASGYSSIEMDLNTGKRGGRAADVEKTLRMLTGAERVLVVNNNASAVLLILSGLASRKRVAIARSQLVEIGGGFRMPDVMRQSGARLVELGTTNKVRLSDYEGVFADTQLVLWVQRSNFKMIGFTAEPELREIAEAGHRAAQIVVDDLGSGALLDTAPYGIAHEPTVQEALAAGADLVCFSGDKLLGGPQAGIIVGKKVLVEKLSKHPMARAMRADRITLAALRATLQHYLYNEATSEIPVWQMLSMPLQLIERRAQSWMDGLGVGRLVSSESTLGGGSAPGETLPTTALALEHRSPEALVRVLRGRTTPVIARAEQGHVLLDPRTVAPSQDELLVGELRTAVAETL